MSGTNKIIIGRAAIKALARIIAKERHAISSKTFKEANKVYLEDKWLWTVLAVDLCSDLETVRKLKKALKEKKLSGAQAFAWILKDWTKTNGRNATLDKLLSILVFNGLTTLAGTIRDAVTIKQRPQGTQEKEKLAVFRLSIANQQKIESVTVKENRPIMRKQNIAACLSPEVAAKMVQVIAFARSSSRNGMRGRQTKELLRMMEQLKELLRSEKELSLKPGNK